MRTKILCFAFAMIMMMVSLPVTFAATPLPFNGNENIYFKIYGGKSLAYAWGERKEPNSMDIHIGGIILNGQTDLKFRGWVLNGDKPTKYASTSPCTYTKNVKVGYTGASYTSFPNKAEMRISIKNSDAAAFAWIKGKYAI